MFAFGVAYYPEQWPEERWAADAQLMAAAGFNVARLAEFAWSRLEPRPGAFDFAWLDRAIATLAAHDIRVVLGTPTASPPPWLMAAQPDLFRVDEQGRRLSFGNRREYCPNHPRYHDATRAVLRALAAHYAGRPDVIGWQVDNEFGERCYCDVCRAAFQRWLGARYGTLDALNAAWGTDFWSHVYTDWAQIPLPLATGGSPNPGLALDFDRFVSDSYVAYQQLQIDLLRDRAPGQFVTHNLMGFGAERINYYDLARALDFVSWDNYPRTQWSMHATVDASGAALSAATMRGLQGRPFWVMEQQAGAGGWELVSVGPRPGELRLWTYQQIAHGATGILYFRWRTARYGTEQFWHGLLEHDARPGRRYAEIAGVGAELRQAGAALEATRVEADVALLLSYESRFAFQIQPNNPGYNYKEHFQSVYRAFHTRNIPVDVRAPTDDLRGYRLVLAPPLYVLPAAVAANLESYVRGGGALVCFFRSGVKDESNAVVNRPLPGLLAELCGVEVSDYDSFPLGVDNGLQWAAPDLVGAAPGVARAWADVLAPRGAEVVAHYSQGYYAGQPAITRHRYGAGSAVYVGAAGDDATHATLAGWLIAQTGVRAPLAAPAGVEVAERVDGARRVLFVLNHTDAPQEVTLPRPYRDLLGGPARRPGALSIAPRDVLVLEQLRDT
jgi:beta-galactosidase